MSRHYASALLGARRVAVMAGYDRMTGSFLLEVNDPDLPEDDFGGHVYESTLDRRLYLADRGTAERPYGGLGFAELEGRLAELCLTLPTGMRPEVARDAVEQRAPYDRRWEA